MGFEGMSLLTELGEVMREASERHIEGTFFYGYDEIKMTTRGIGIKRASKLDAMKIAYARFGGLKQNIIISDPKGKKGEVKFVMVETGAEIEGAD